MKRRTLFFLAFALSGAVACSRPYRVGDKVLVEWGEERLLYPAFIIEMKGKSRFRVHYDGYPSRWDEDVELARIQGYVTSAVAAPPPPLKVRVARGLGTKDAVDAPVSPFKAGDRVRVHWRESAYRAVVLEVVSSTELLVHYEGHEDAWDEIVAVSRVVSGS